MKSYPSFVPQRPRPGFSGPVAFWLGWQLVAACSGACPAGSVQVGAECTRAGTVEADDAATAIPPHDAADAALASSARPRGGDGSHSAGMQAPGTDAGAPRDSGGGGGGAAGVGGAPNASLERTCTKEGELRCSPLGASKRERCSSGQWQATEPCAANEACVAAAAGQIMCTATLELCSGSGGTAVCDGDGTLYVCSPNATVSHQETCLSVKLCQASLAPQSCLLCNPQHEHRCEGKTLDVCDDDGMGWRRLSECDTEALCNATLGRCTTAVCEPNSFVCQNNTLKKCNEAGTGFDGNPQPCGANTCDAEGGDCDTCQPSMQTCRDANTVLTCNATGQGANTTPCPNGMKCVGAGHCVACTLDADCAAISKDCRVGVCSTNSCTLANAPDGQTCRATFGSGVCQGGGCACVPKCDKPCGDSGCPNQPCPNKCGSRMCHLDSCVDCITAADCNHLDNDCNEGACIVGRCVTAPQSRMCLDSTGAPSVCSNGRCPECIKSCAGKCAGESDGCGGSCPNVCGANERCAAGKCQECTPGQTGCRGNYSDGTPGSCTSELTGCYFTWTVDKVVSRMVCDANGRWTYEPCGVQCTLSNGVVAYQCATPGATSECITSGTCL